MAAVRSVWAWIGVAVAAVALGGAAVALAVPVGVISDSDCGWAWQAIGRRDTGVCRGPGWRHIGLAVVLLAIAGGLLAAAVRQRQSGPSMHSGKPSSAMWVAIGSGVLGAPTAIAVFVAPPGNQLDDRFELWQTLAGVSSTLGLVALLLGSLAAIRVTHGVLSAVIPGGIAVI